MDIMYILDYWGNNNLCEKAPGDNIYLMSAVKERSQKFHNEVIKEEKRQYF